MMPNNSLNNKRIAKNTILLYIRFLFLLGISLYTSRLVLLCLGIEDFGLYNVVGGLVVIFTFLNSAMANSSNRYITYALGKGDEKQLHDIVSVTCMFHWILAGFIFILAETIGLWFLNNKLNIPEGRMFAVFWVYQFSVIACLVSVVNVPYNAMIIAHEKMSVFAFISILDAILKLIVVILIQNAIYDKLILYAGLILSVNICIRLIYRFYCKRVFSESRCIRFKKYPQLKEITSFAGWSLLGNLAFIGYTQGINILINIFFGPSINAARGVAVQVQSATKAFISSFQTAVNPQITKTYALGNYERLHSLIYASSKFSFFLLLCIVLPFSIEAKAILSLWLKEVPDYAVVFTILTLCIMLVDTLSNPINIANNATGDIKKYQIVEGGTLLLIVPISYIVLEFDGSPVSVFLVQLAVMYFVQVLRLFLVCYKIKMSKLEYTKNVLVPVVSVALLSLIPPVMCLLLFPHNVYTSIFIICISIFCVIVFSYFVGLNKSEKKIVIDKISSIKANHKHK